MSTKKGSSVDHVRQWIQDYLKQTGPSKTRVMRSASPPRIRDHLTMTLVNMYNAGQLERKPDGQYRGKPTYRWALPKQQIVSALPKVYHGERTLLLFQQAAREQLGVELMYIDRLRMAQCMELAA